jgi:hypothetical protein
MGGFQHETVPSTVGCIHFVAPTIRVFGLLAVAGEIAVRATPGSL